jgi:glycosyltransferase involved in cell wall biosynthesis
MKLVLVIPSYNRCRSLARTLQSVLDATVPEGLEFAVVVVDNRSTDETKATVENFSQNSKIVIGYVPEFDSQGRSFALNAGIRASESELIGFIDDDEEIDKSWFQVVCKAFEDPEVDYIGGPYVPCWQSEPPAWVNHPHTRTAVGWAHFGNLPRPYGEPEFDALLMGGNSILRRSCFQKVGVYSTDLGRKGKRLFAGEDADMHERLMRAGLRGLYLPSLIVHHHIPAERLQKSYMRRWAFWASASNGYNMRTQAAPAAEEHSPLWSGLPRYMYANALRAPFKWVRARLGGAHPADVFHHELALWRFAGTFYGRNFLSL